MIAALDEHGLALLLAESEVTDHVQRVADLIAQVMQGRFRVLGATLGVRVRPAVR